MVFILVFFKLLLVCLVKKKDTLILKEMKISGKSNGRIITKDSLMSFSSRNSMYLYSNVLGDLGHMIPPSISSQGGEPENT